MKLLYTLGLIVIWTSLFIRAEDNSDLQQYIEKLLAQLRNEHVYQRKIAARQLIEIGNPAVVVMLRQYSQMDFMMKREVVSILGTVGTPECQEQLLMCMFDIDKGVRSRTALTLLHLVDQNPQLEGKIRKLQHDKEEIQEDINALHYTIIRKKVETALVEMISPQGGWGFYEGQFNHLLPLGTIAISILVDIFTNDQSRLVVVAYEDDKFKMEKMRYLAGDAIADFGTLLNNDEKNTVVKELEKLESHTNKDLWETATYTLYRLGARSHLERIMQVHAIKISQYEQEIRRYQRLKNVQYVKELQEDIARSYSSLAMIYLRIREDKKAIGMLTLAINNNPSYSLNYYNLACAYSCVGEIEKGLEALENAIEKGYEDLGWIYKDGDLKNVRNHPRFPQLIEKLRNKLKSK